MVPHGKVEEALQQAAGAEVQVFAVTGLPDEKKGERLAVLHTVDDTTIPDILAKLSASGLPNLFIPSRHHFVKVDAFPGPRNRQAGSPRGEANRSGTTLFT